MVVTRSMAISEEVKEYFANLIEPLATHNSIQKMIEEFKKVIVPKIEKLEKHSEEQDRRIEILETSCSLRQNVIDNFQERINQLERKSDDNEQYSRRSCLRIHGIEWKGRSTSDDGKEDVKKIVEDCCLEMGIPYNDKDIDRAHRIGKEFFDKETQRTIKSIIVKFRSWESRKRFYNARPKASAKGVKKPGARKFGVAVDLTKNRHALLQHAKEVIKHYPEVNFAFADVNCSLGIRVNNSKMLFFHDKDSLYDHLGNLNYVPVQE